MWSLRVVLLSPFFDDALGFTQGVDDFAIEHFASNPPVEAFAISFLPRCPRFDVGGFRADGSDPVPNRLRNELESIAPSE